MIHQPSSAPSSLVCFLLLPLAVLDAAAIISRHTTHFRINGNLTCPHREEGTWWCIKVYLYEYDTMDKDMIAQYGFMCTTRKTMEYRLDGYDDDDGIGDNFYELYSWIYHNCTLHGLITLEVHNLSSIPVTATQVTLNKTYDVSLKGVPVADWP